MWNYCTVMYSHVLVCTSTYRYVLICQILSRGTGFQVQTLYIQILKIINMYIHVYTFLQMYIHEYILYVHGMYILRYKRVCTLFRRVCTCLYYYVCVLKHINMYVQFTNLYIECWVAHVQCTDGYIHFMKCTEIAEQPEGTHNDISFWMQLFDRLLWRLAQVLSSNLLLTTLDLVQPLALTTAWYPRIRQSEWFSTASWRCKASFWSIRPPLLPLAWVPVHSWCSQNRVNDESMQMWFIFFYLLYNKIFTWSVLRSFSAHDNTNESWRIPLIG